MDSGCGPRGPSLVSQCTNHWFHKSLLFLSFKKEKERRSSEGGGRKKIGGKIGKKKMNRPGYGF